ncbi:MAG TPA: ATP-binding protein [Myxococcaceae bacterium]|nr:ATP-binding protein [Myxococcaceae bacterium]
MKDSEFTSRLLGSGAAAQRLRERKAEILEVYVQAARAELEAARGIDLAELVDNLPELLDTLARALEQGESVAKLAECATRFGMKHGQSRARQQSYSLNDVLTEYRLLSQAIFTTLRQLDRLDSQAEDIIRDAIHRGIANSATEFSRLRSQAEQAQQQERERALRERLYSSLMHAPVAIAVLQGPELVYEFTNHRYRDIVGSDRALEGLRFEDGLAELNPARVVLHKRVFATGEAFSCRELPVVLDYDRNGKPYERFWNLLIQPIRNAEGQIEGVLTCASEVTEHIRDRQRIEATFLGMKEERELREWFVSTLSHDLRIPLTAAKMSSQLLFRGGDDPLRLRKLAGRIADNIDRADQMIRDLLDTNRIKAGERLSLELDRCNLNEIAKQTIEELSTIHGDRFVLQAQAPIEGHWNCNGIRRLLENLCVNGVKYGAPHRPVTVSLETEAEHVKLQVHNEGPPIPADELPNLFEAFRRSKTARASSQRGWGLGLTLVKGFTEAHGGTVSVTSAQEQGTRFTVMLPLDARGHAPPGKPP